MKALEEDYRWMKLALEEARTAMPYDVPVGALVLNERRELLSKTHNRREELKRISGHAEILALDEAAQRVGDWRLEGCILYVTLEPCAMCMGAILQSRLSKVVFGAFDDKQSNIKPFTGKLQIVEGVMEEECSQLLKTFFRS